MDYSPVGVCVAIACPGDNWTFHVLVIYADDNVAMLAVKDCLSWLVNTSLRSSKSGMDHARFFVAAA